VGAQEIRIIVSFEDRFRAYRTALATAIGILRPDAEVITVEAESLGGAARHFRPDVVIGSRREEPETGGATAWIELSVDPSRPTKVRVNGVRSEIFNPTLDTLLAIIERVAPLP
jgi:hypothetical protein